MLPDRPRAWYAYVAAVAVLALITYAPGQSSVGVAAALWTAQLPVSLVAALGIAAAGAVADAELGRLVLRRLRRA